MNIKMQYKYCSIEKYHFQNIIINMMQYNLYNAVRIQCYYLNSSILIIHYTGNITTAALDTWVINKNITQLAGMEESRRNTGGSFPENKWITVYIYRYTYEYIYMYIYTGELDSPWTNIIKMHAHKPQAGKRWKTYF